MYEIDDLQLAQSRTIFRRTIIRLLTILIPLVVLFITLLAIGLPTMASAPPLSYVAGSNSFENMLEDESAGEDIAYVAVANHDYLALVDPVAGTVIDTVDLAPSGCNFPWRVAIPPDDQTVWVSCRYSSKVIVLARSDNEILHAFDGQQYPAGIAFTQDSAFALIGTQSYGDVIIVDTNTFTIAATVETDNYPVSVVMHPHLPIAYAAHRLYEGGVSVIETTSWMVTQRIKAGHYPHHAVISRDGLWLYLSNKNNNSVSVIDTAALKQETEIAIGAMPRDLALSPDDQTLYVTRSWGDGISIIDTATNSVTQTLAITTSIDFSRPWGMDLTCDGSMLITTNSGRWGEENQQIALTDTDALTMTLLPMPDNNSDGYPDYGARGVAICPQYVPEDIFLTPPEQTKQANRGIDAIYSVSLFNFTGMEDSYTVTLGLHDWNTVLSSDSAGPLIHGESAGLTVTVTVPHDADWFSTDSVLITATSVISPTIYEVTATLKTEAYAPPAMTVSPLTLSSTQQVGETVHKTLDISNGLGVDLEFELGTSLGPGTSFAAASTELFGFIVPGAYLRAIGLSDDTNIQLLDLSTGSLIQQNSSLDRYETWTVYPGSGTYFKLLSDKAVVAVEENGSYWGFSSFIPSVDTGPVGREFIFYHSQRNPWLYAFAVEDADIEFRDASGNILHSDSLDAGEYWKLNPESGVYHVVATGRIAMELVAENAYTTVPSSDGQPVGQRFYFATHGWGTGAVAAFAYKEADIELYDLDTNTLLHSTHLNTGEHWWQVGLENRQLRLESSGDVEVWAGNTEGGQEIEDLGDDISFAGGRYGREYYLHSLREGFVIFAPFENTQVNVDNTSYSLSKDDYLHFPDCCAVHRIIANQPILVQTVGRDGSWNDMGSYLGGVVSHTGESVPWLAIDPGSGAVPTDSSTAIDVTFDAIGIQPGLHTADLIVISNDPSLPFIEIPLDMQVEPTADMGQVSGSVSDAWTGEHLAAEVALQGVHAELATPSYEIWAVEGSYTLIASKDGYVTREFSIDITAGGNTLQDIELEPDLARLELDPESLNEMTVEGSTTAAALNIVNTGPALLEVSIHELPSLENRMGATLLDLQNRKILYDRAHDEPLLSDFDSLVDDLTTAGATVDQNFIYPIDASVLDGYDVLWINCCGYTSWTFNELNVLKTWLDDGGAILIHGGESPVTSGPAEIYGIEYHSSCSYGTTTDIEEHPITVDIKRVYVNTCSYLTFGSTSTLAVKDTSGQPHVVAHEQDRGKMVVVSGSDFNNWSIDEDDNRVLAHNIFTWLAEPGYEDVPWLYAVPAGAQVPGHTSQEITVHFDASNLDNGAYKAILAIEHDDPNRTSPVKLPVTLSVGEGLGRIIVDKVTKPSGGPQSFPFSLTGGPDAVIENFTLTGAAAPWDSGELKSGTYKVAETVPDDWIQYEATCSNGSSPSTVQLDPGETVTCTFNNHKLKADFSASPTSGAPPLKVDFTNLSIGDIDKCLWEFGDGRAATTCGNTSHEYKDEGLYTVSLTVKGPDGEDKLIKEEYVKVSEHRIFLPVVLGTK